MANRIGCAASTLLFSHLGILVDQAMTRTSSWVFVIDRFQSKLSNWNAKCLSFGGQLMLVKSM